MAQPPAVDAATLLKIVEKRLGPSATAAAKKAVLCALGADPEQPPPPSDFYPLPAAPPPPSPPVDPPPEFGDVQWDEIYGMWTRKAPDGNFLYAAGNEEEKPDPATVRWLTEDETSNHLFPSIVQLSPPAGPQNTPPGHFELTEADLAKIDPGRMKVFNLEMRKYRIRNADGSWDTTWKRITTDVEPNPGDKVLLHELDDFESARQDMTDEYRERITAIARPGAAAPGFLHGEFGAFVFSAAGHRWELFDYVEATRRLEINRIAAASSADARFAVLGEKFFETTVDKQGQRDVRLSVFLDAQAFGRKRNDFIAAYKGCKDTFVFWCSHGDLFAFDPQHRADEMIEQLFGVVRARKTTVAKRLGRIPVLSLSISGAGLEGQVDKARVEALLADVLAAAKSKRKIIWEEA